MSSKTNRQKRREAKKKDRERSLARKAGLSKGGSSTYSTKRFGLGGLLGDFRP